MQTEVLSAYDSVVIISETDEVERYLEGKYKNSVHTITQFGIPEARLLKQNNVHIVLAISASREFIARQYFELT